MDTKSILEIITQVSFPIVIVIAMFWWIGVKWWPKYNDTMDKLVTDFRQEMQAEREFHQARITELSACMNANTALLREDHAEIKERVRMVK